MRGHLLPCASKLLYFQALAAVNIAVSSFYPFCLHCDLSSSRNLQASGVGQTVSELDNVIEPP